jgi:hypothetical protein
LFLNQKETENKNLGIMKTSIIGKYKQLILNKHNLSYKKVLSPYFSLNIDKNIFSNAKVLSRRK